MRRVEDRMFMLTARNYYNLLDALAKAQQSLLDATIHMAGNSRPVEDHICIYDEHDLCFECDVPKKKMKAKTAAEGKQ